MFDRREDTRDRQHLRLSMNRLTRTTVIHLLRQGWERRALEPFGTASLQLVKGIVRRPVGLLRRDAETDIGTTASDLMSGYVGPLV